MFVATGRRSRAGYNWLRRKGRGQKLGVLNHASRFANGGWRSMPWRVEGPSIAPRVTVLRPIRPRRVGEIRRMSGKTAQYSLKAAELSAIFVPACGLRRSLCRMGSSGGAIPRARGSGWKPRSQSKENSFSDRDRFRVQGYWDNECHPRSFADSSVPIPRWTTTAEIPGRTFLQNARTMFSDPCRYLLPSMLRPSSLWDTPRRRASG
jgi:hypothetical protein